MEQYLRWCWYLRWVHGLRWQRRCFGTDLIHWWYGVVWWCHKQVFWTLCRFRLIAFVITSAICQGWKVKGLNLLRLKICTLQRRQQDRLSYRPSRNPSGSKWLRLFCSACLRHTTLEATLTIDAEPGFLRRGHKPRHLGKCRSWKFSTITDHREVTWSWWFRDGKFKALNNRAYLHQSRSRIPESVHPQRYSAAQPQRLTCEKSRGVGK